MSMWCDAHIYSADSRTELIITGTAIIKSEMPLPQSFELPAAADFHVHLRDGPMSAAVVPTIRQGGVK